MCPRTHPCATCAAPCTDRNTHQSWTRTNGLRSWRAVRVQRRWYWRRLSSGRCSPARTCVGYRHARVARLDACLHLVLQDYVDEQKSARKHKRKARARLHPLGPVDRRVDIHMPPSHATLYALSSSDHAPLAIDQHHHHHPSGLSLTPVTPSRDTRPPAVLYAPSLQQGWGYTLPST